MDNSAETYRNKISTVDHSGKRVWVYAKQPEGRLYNIRSIVAYLLIAVLFVMPLLKVNGEPFLLFNIVERKFIICSVIFTVQDFPIFALSMIIFMVFIVMFTVLFGRLFCGWVCPQTIFLEFVFRRIEYLIEGNAK